MKKKHKIEVVRSLFFFNILVNLYYSAERIKFKQHAMIPLCMEPFLHKKLLIRKGAKWRKKAKNIGHRSRISSFCRTPP